MSLDGIPLPGIYATDAEFEDGGPGATLAGQVSGLARKILDTRAVLRP
jgi:hypothetical protein